MTNENTCGNFGVPYGMGTVNSKEVFGSKKSKKEVQAAKKAYVESPKQTK